MNTEEYLTQASLLSAQVDARLPELRHWNELLEKACAGCGEEKGTSPAAAAAKIKALREQLNRQIDALVDTRQEIAARIASLEDPLYRTLLELRFLRGMSWEAVSAELGYSRRHVYRLRDRAFAAIERSRAQSGEALPCRGTGTLPN